MRFDESFPMIKLIITIRDPCEKPLINALSYSFIKAESKRAF